MKFISEVAGSVAVIALLAVAVLAAGALLAAGWMAAGHLWSKVRPRITRRYVAATALVVALIGAAIVASTAWMAAPAPAPAAPSPARQMETPDPNAPEYRELPNGRWQLCITKELLTDDGDYECTRWSPTVPPGGTAQPQHERLTIDPDAVTA